MTYMSNQDKEWEDYLLSIKITNLYDQAEISKGLSSRGGKTAITYAPTGRQLINKRCKEFYTHAVLTQHKRVDIGDFGYYKWCKSLEEALICKEEIDVWIKEDSHGFINVVIVPCKMVNPWELKE